MKSRLHGFGLGLTWHPWPCVWPGAFDDWNDETWAGYTAGLITSVLGAVTAIVSAIVWITQRS